MTSAAWRPLWRAGDVSDMAAVVAASEPWSAVARRRKRAAGRRPRQGEEPQAEPEADSEAVLRRLLEAQ